MSAILTVPEPVDPADEYLITGNEWVTLPDIDPQLAAPLSVNVLWEAGLGLVEFRPAGRPLLRPWLRAGTGAAAGTEARAPQEGLPLSWRAEAVNGWLPVFRAAAAGLELEVRYAAPPGCKGFLAELRVTRPAGGGAEAVPGAGAEGAAAGAGAAGASDGAVPVAAGFDLAWGPPRAVRFTAQELAAGYAVRVDPWTSAVRVEALGAPALAVRAQGEGGDGRLVWVPAWPEPGARAAGVDRAVPWPAGLSGAAVGWAARLRPGETCALTLHFGLNREGDGAALNAVDLARRGAKALWAAAVEAAAGDAPAGLPEPVRRNLIFNLHGAAGRCLDSEAPVAVTSRSPRYYVAAAHWTRDALLWSLPGLIRTRPERAREALLAVFRRHTRHPGEHAQYLDGTVVYPGFELDQLAAFAVALDRYIDETGDASAARDPAVRRAWPRLAAAVAAARDGRTGLYRTFLLPTDDPAPLPFVTYDNALLCVALEAAARRGWPLAPRPAEAAVELRRAMMRHLVVDGPFGPQWAGATDGERHLLFDEPPGSLELLAHYGFCAADDPLYRHTVRWVRSAHNPRAILHEGRWEPSCEHAPFRWVLGWANALWAGAAAVRTLERRRAEAPPGARAEDAGAPRRGDAHGAVAEGGAAPGWLVEAVEAAEVALQAFLTSPMDGGLACETVGDDGRLRTGAAFATCAGFVAAAAMEWLRARERLRAQPSAPSA
ncbi:MAG: hypothetical protein IMW98_03730 [Firmicutes bacterium]|nr:hypothetical protein [Bacillota bacterium]